MVKTKKSVNLRGRGRPSKYLDVMTKDNINKMYEMSANGDLIDQVCVGIGICRRTYHYWVLQHKDFLHIHNMCRTLRSAFWIADGRKNMQNSKFNSNLYSFFVRQISNWHLNQYAVTTDFLPRDVLKQLLTDDKGNKLSTEEKMNKLNELQLELGLNATAVKKQLECLREQLNIENERRGAFLENKVRSLEKLVK